MWWVTAKYLKKDTDGKQKTIAWNSVNILNLAFKLENTIYVLTC